MGKVVIITNSKGGPGKTTTAVNLALCAARRGYSTAMIDADKQQHSYKWLEAVSDVEVIDAHGLADQVGEVKAIVEATADEHELVFIDTPGHDKEPGLVQTLTLCSDVALIITQPSALDAAELGNSLQFVRVAQQALGKLESHLVFNCTPDNDKDAREFEEEAGPLGLSIAGTRLPRKKALQRAALKHDLTKGDSRVIAPYYRLFDELLSKHLPQLGEFDEHAQAQTEAEDKKVANG